MSCSQPCGANLDTLPFRAPRRGSSKVSCDRHLASCGSPLYRYRAYSDTVADTDLASQTSFACHAGACGAILCCGSRCGHRSCRCDRPWWRWVQPSRVSSLTTSRSSFDCLTSSTGTDTRESAHSQSNWCALIFCCRPDFWLGQLTEMACDSAQPLTPRWWIAIAWPAIGRAMSVSLPLQWSSCVRQGFSRQSVPGPRTEILFHDPSPTAETESLWRRCYKFQLAAHVPVARGRGNTTRRERTTRDGQQVLRES